MFYKSLGDEYEQCLYQAEDAELSLWTERVLFAVIIEAVFAES